MTQTEHDTIWLTPEAQARLKAELERRSGVERQEIVERISAARDEGDLKENGGYHAAKDEQGTNEARIRQLEDLLREATTTLPEDDGVVRPGKVVTYRFAGDEDEVILLGDREIETDDLQVVSPQSPIGAALVGATSGDTVDFETPTGKVVKLTVVSATPYTS
jgi:transcription elongation factor GreA